jgi:hypothetical protein
VEQRTRVPIVLDGTDVVLNALHGNLEFEKLKDGISPATSRGQQCWNPAKLLTDCLVRNNKYYLKSL